MSRQLEQLQLVLVATRLDRLDSSTHVVELEVGSGLGTGVPDPIVLIKVDSLVVYHIFSFLYIRSACLG